MAGSMAKGWEAQLAHWHRQYRRDGRGLIVKTEPGVKVGAHGRPIAWEGVAPVDFVGVLDGRGVFMDAKATAKAKFRADLMPPHQRVMLERAYRLGCWSFVALRCSSGLWRLDWPLTGTIDPVAVGVPIDPVIGWAP